MIYVLQPYLPMAPMKKMKMHKIICLVMIYLMAAEPKVVYKSSHTRDKLEEYIADYNKMYNTSFSTKG